MARVKDIRIHDFRHSCASLLIDSGANITLVAKYLGHKETLPDPEEESYNYEEDEIIKPKNKDDIVL